MTEPTARQRNRRRTAESSPARAVRASRRVHPPRVGKDKQAKVEAAPRAVREIAWKAQHRLYARYRALTRKGKLKTVAITALARELAAFIWAVSREIATTGGAAAHKGIRG